MLKKWQTATLESIDGWDEFVNEPISSDRVANNKKILLDIARSGQPRPSWKRPFGKVLIGYTNRSCNSYDALFDEQIRQLAPHWFANLTIDRKQQLLEMARNGAPRPKMSELGKFLAAYTRSSNSSHQYDLQFDKEIRALAPHWWVSDYKKQQLLEMAIKGEPRPHCNKFGNEHPLGKPLVTYTTPKSLAYDAIFDKKIRKLVPHWFLNTASENKKKLLVMAANGEKRPNSKKETLGQALVAYTNQSRSTFDACFDAKIRQLAPLWFKVGEAEPCTNNN